VSETKRVVQVMAMAGEDKARRSKRERVVWMCWGIVTAKK
jgi:hypothetical protein